jgi:hypothetical protein
MQRQHSTWKAIILTIASLWSLLTIVLLCSPYRHSARDFLLAVYIISAFLVLMVHGLIGSTQQRNQDIRRRISDSSTCEDCKRTDRPLRLIIYESYTYVILLIISREFAGTLCQECASRRLRKMFWYNVIGCILFPPYIVWAGIRRWAILRSYRNKS